MIPRRAKRDASEPEIVTALEQCGFSVERISQARFPDLIVGWCHKRMWLVECKSSDKGYGKELNANQKKFADRWRGTPIVILRNAQEAIDWAVQVAVEAA